MENSNITSAKQKKIKLDFKESKYATGRRKRSIAKVWVKKGTGNIHVNGLKMKEYFKRPVHQIIVTRPLEIYGSNIILKLNSKREIQSKFDLKEEIKKQVNYVRVKGILF